MFNNKKSDGIAMVTSENVQSGRWTRDNSLKYWGIMVLMAGFIKE